MAADDSDGEFSGADEPEEEDHHDDDDDPRAKEAAFMMQGRQQDDSSSDSEPVVHSTAFLAELEREKAMHGRSHRT